jgi:hypothetical protein
MSNYETVAVQFEHTTADSDTRRINRAVMTVYGHSAFAVRAELTRQYPSFRDIVVLDVQQQSRVEGTR